MGFGNFGVCFRFVSLNKDEFTIDKLIIVNSDHITIVEPYEFIVHIRTEIFNETGSVPLIINAKYPCRILSRWLRPRAKRGGFPQLLALASSCPTCSSVTRGVREFGAIITLARDDSVDNRLHVRKGFVEPKLNWNRWNLPGSVIESFHRYMSHKVVVMRNKS